jgi:signal transduction histidine kinase
MLEQLLEITEPNPQAALEQVANLVAEVFRAAKVDVLVYEPAKESLVAVGTSDTPMGHRQHAIGMDRLPLANGGRAVGVYQTGQAYLTGNADLSGDLPGLVDGLGIRSHIIAPLQVAGQRRGVLLASAAQRDFFLEEHLRLLERVAQWVGLVLHRAELAERLALEAAARSRNLAAEELIAVLAHDLRNYLSPMQVRVQALRRKGARGEADQVQKGLSALEADVRRLGAILNDILDAERLERGLFTLSPCLVDLAAVACETAAALGEERTRIVVVGDQTVCVNADLQRIRQAVLNLLANAVKHSPDGATVTVEVQAEQRDGREGGRITVSDQGPGVPADLIPRIFTRYAAGSQSQGLGLGLFLAERIASAHGGALALDSPPGAGARFSLWLPVA